MRELSDDDLILLIGFHHYLVASGVAAEGHKTMDLIKEWVTWNVARDTLLQAQRRTI